MINGNLQSTRLGDIRFLNEDAIKMNNDKNKFEETIDVCVKNGRRLLEDAKMMRDFSRFPTSKALAILAQEEFAKAYIIRLVQEGAIPWCNEIIQATRDHQCKQIMGIVMEYLFTPWENGSLLERENRIKEKYPDFTLPKKVADALMIFCYEKIAKWKSSTWGWVEPPSYNLEAKRVWTGKLEKSKQDAIYVSIGKNGEVTNIPTVNEEDVNRQIEYTEILEEVSTGQDVFAFTEREYIKSVLAAIFRGIYASNPR